MAGEFTTPSEVGIQLVQDWIGKISREYRVEEMEPGIVRAALEAMGANFEPSAELKYLGEYTNKAKRPGLDAVWGKERVEDYKGWAKAYAQSHEQLVGPLPELEKSGSKTSGMIQFFGELTAFAAEKLSFADFKRYTEIRAENGRLWMVGRKDERIRTSVPTAKGPILISSFPHGFPSAAWEKIKSWHK